MTNGQPSRVRRLLDDLRTAAAMPRVRVVLSRGEPDDDALLRAFRRRHPRYKVVGSKAVGAALLPLDDFPDVDAYLAAHRTARKRVLRAARLGYSVAIHTSLPERQGRPIDPEYLDPDATWDRGPKTDYVGVFHDGVLVGYAAVRYAGDIAGIGRIMGHGDHLENGIMFLLTARIVEHVKTSRPQARYLFYDTFFGAPAGLRWFKTHLGFQPHYVRWTREQRQPSASPR
jgi:hypothetical protein